MAYHISEIIDETLPSLIAAEGHATCEPTTDEARAAEAGLSVEEWREAMNESCKHQEWLDNMREAHETKYTVWVGGVGNQYTNLIDAQVAAQEWRDKGYDDVVLESEVQ